MEMSCKVAPQAIRSGLRSEMGEAVIMFPPKACTTTDTDSQCGERKGESERGRHVRDREAYRRGGAETDKRGRHRQTNRQTDRKRHETDRQRLIELDRNRKGKTEKHIREREREREREIVQQIQNHKRDRRGDRTRQTESQIHTETREID